MAVPESSRVNDAQSVSYQSAIFGTENRGLHLAKTLPEAAMQNGFMHNPTVGGHYAITVPDLTKTKSAHKAVGVPLIDAGAYEFADIEQNYMFDPEDGIVEFNQVAD